MSAKGLKPNEELYIYSMGKRLRIIAYALTEDDANAYMALHDEAAVISCVGGLVLLADKHDKGLPIRTEQTAR